MIETTCLPRSLFGGQQLLGLGDQRGVMKPRAAAERGDDQPVDPAQPDPRGAEVEHCVPGRVQARHGSASGDGLARAALARDHADRLLGDAPRDPGDRFCVGAMRVQHPRREVLAERHPREPVMHPQPIDTHCLPSCWLV
jgi:hypothetical protein